MRMWTLENNMKNLLNTFYSNYCKLNKAEQRKKRQIASLQNSCYCSTFHSLDIASVQNTKQAKINCGTFFF